VQTITKIMLPIPCGLVTTMIYSFIAAWNDSCSAYLHPVKQKMPLVLGLYNFVGRWTTQWELLNAAAFVALIPCWCCSTSSRSASWLAWPRRDQG